MSCSVMTHVPLDSWSPLNVLCAVAAKDQSIGSMSDSAMNDTMSSSSSVSSLDSGCTSDGLLSSASSPPAVQRMTTANSKMSSHPWRKKSLTRMTSITGSGSGSRQDEEALAASALLDLATTGTGTTTGSCSSSNNIIINNKTSVITSNQTLLSSQHSNTNRPIAACFDAKDNLVHLMVTSSAQGQRVLQLPKGMEFLLNSKIGSSPLTAASLPSGYPMSEPCAGEAGRQYAVIDLSKKKRPEDSNNNNSTDQENPASVFSEQQPYQQSFPISSQETVTHVLAPNVLHFLPPNHLNVSRDVCADKRENSFSSNSSSCSSVDGSESCGSLSQHHVSVIKKRGRKRLYDDTDQMHAPSNPIREFRQRQRVRERQEDERLLQLESRYKNAQLPTLPASLDELYDSRGLNMKFPRVKTAMKRGKAVDDSERTNRKKECARRDSKNYRERAKAKRDLIVKKISFLEDLFKSIAVPKYQYVFG